MDRAISSISASGRRVYPCRSVRTVRRRAAQRAPRRPDDPRRRPARPAARRTCAARRPRSSSSSPSRSPPPRRWSPPAQPPSRRSPTPTCRSASGATTSPRRSATTRWSSSPARPARARPPSCPRSASNSAAASAAPSATPSRAGSPPAPSPSASPTNCSTPLGDAVGYTVRFTDQVSDRTLVKLMTDGILLAEIQRDRRLLRYDTLILDEAHERSLNIDFLLGYLRELLPRRPDLKVIVTSATIEPAALRARTSAARPIVEVSGRTYPVEIRYRPLEVAVAVDDDDDDPDDPDHEIVRTEMRDQTEAIVDAVARTRRASRPATCWCSCPASARSATPPKRCAARADATPRCCRSTRGCPPPSSRRCSQPHTGRRIVLATNVAETSLTVPGHPLRRRPRHRAHLALQPPHQGAAAADRADLAGLGRAARRPLRARRARRLHPAVLRGGLRRAAALHRPGDPAHQPRRGDPADGGAATRRHRGLPVPRPARSRAASATASRCCRNSARSTATARSPTSAAGSRSCPSTRGSAG